jgi:hypothetical protein
MIPAPALQQIHMDPDRPVRRVGEGALLTELPAAAIDLIVTMTGPNVDTPLQSIEIRHLGGALGRDAPSAGAQARIDAGFAMFSGGPAPKPAVWRGPTGIPASCSVDRPEPCHADVAPWLHVS